ncbi:FecR family protein [Psychrosphaera sp. 1_MG-2023]|uniref:FecR family protein n=1 Tax=Psychrosphaera sp. 1_MG-2023 TaxID=3062643 RepID=UPI0026E240B0|nr:FecR family protein [Psychrosphaera sp. 1_MG-2023]MDO6718225.1 FecR family protein [Psychrosphaera sp. 1_MG-2023]
MLIRSVLLLSGLMFISNSQAQTAAGKTLVTRGEVSAISSSGADTRKLKRRSPIYSSDVVSTGANAKAQLRMTDGGMIALKENSELLISDYKFSDDNGRGSVVMELVKGGLRSVTGSIKAESGDYKLKTPVGSIGIRGTHYEVEIVGGTIWVAVWDGAVDLDITSGDQSGSTLSLGQNEGYSYASIDPQGKVTTFIEPPQTFETGMTTEADDIDQNEEEEEEEETQEESTSSTVATTTVVASITVEADSDSEENTDAEDEAEIDSEVEQAQEVATTVEEDADNLIEDESFLATDDFNSLDTTPIEELLAERTGDFTYNQLANSSLESSVGPVSNFQVAMTIDFDKGTVPEGNMSFDDAGGEWFATFDGVINIDEIDLDITYASHGDNLADGDIEVDFLDGLDSIIGDFTLEEIANPDINVKGTFTIK